MRLGIRMLSNNSSLNQLFYVNQVNVNPGENNYPIYFQLVDLDQQDPAQQKAPIRYIPISSATMSIVLNSLNVANTLTKIPSNPFPDDRSIWSFNLLAADTAIMAGINMTVTLTEGANIRIATAAAAILVGPKSNYSC